MRKFALRDKVELMSVGTASNEELSLRDVVDLIDTRFESLDLHLEEQFGALEHRLGRVESAVLDVREDLNAALAAIDTDAETLIVHDARITKLEEAHR